MNPGQHPPPTITDSGNTTQSGMLATLPSFGQWMIVCSMSLASQENTQVFGEPELSWLSVLMLAPDLQIKVILGDQDGLCCSMYSRHTAMRLFSEDQCEDMNNSRNHSLF